MSTALHTLELAPVFNWTRPAFGFGYTPAMGEALDGKAVRQLFEQHGPMVLRRAQRILGDPEEAREAVQEVFIRVLRGADGFESRSQATTWLYRITTNYCLSQLRNRRRRSELFEANVRHAVRPQGEPAPTTTLLLRRLLSEADEQQAQAVAYVYLDGMSHREAAEVMGVSKRTVGNLLERFQAWARPRVASASEAPPAPDDREAPPAADDREPHADAEGSR